MKTKSKTPPNISFKGWIVYFGLAYLLIPQGTNFFGAMVFGIGLIIVLDILGLTRF